jgi:hypothetical protein
MQAPDAAQAPEDARVHGPTHSLLLILAAVLALWFVSAIYVVAIADCRLDPIAYFFGSNPHRCEKTPSSIAAAVPATQPRWYVLRDHQTGYCWAANVPAGYRRAFAQTAGGPFAAEEQARDRMHALQSAAACQPE